MALSEIRVNTTKTRTGVGTITYTETGPVITGIATASNFKTGSTNVHSTGVELANINTGGSTATFGGPISGTNATFSGTVSIGGTLTYEDVTNIDSVGLITARNGITVSAGDLVVGAASYNTTGSFGARSNGEFRSVLPQNTASSTMLGAIGGASNGFNIVIDSSNNQTYKFHNGSAQSVTITDNGRLYIGTINSGTYDGIQPQVQLEGTNYNTSSMSLFCNSNTSNNAPQLQLGRSRSGSDGGTTALQNGDRVGSIYGIAADGSDRNSSVGSIQFYVDGSVSTNQTPGSIRFATTASNASTPTEALRINSNSRVNIGHLNQTGSQLDYTRLNIYGQTSSGGTNKNLNLLNVYNYGSGNVGDITGIGLGCGASPGSYTKASIAFIRTTTYGRGDLIFCINDQGNSNPVVEGNERLRIAKNGQVCIGEGFKSSGGGQLTIRGLGVNAYAVQDYQYIGTPSANTTLSQIRFTANTSGDSVIQGARIQARSDAAWSATGDAPTRLEFWTTPDGSASAVERFRIDKEGQLTNTLQATSFVTTKAFSNLAKLDIRGTNIADSNHYILSYGEGHANDHEFHMVNTVGHLVFRTGSSGLTERVRINSNGEMSIGGQHADHAYDANSYGNPSLLIAGDDNADILTLMNDDPTPNNGDYASLGFRVAGQSTGSYAKAAIIAERNGGYNAIDLLFCCGTDADATRTTTSHEIMRVHHNRVVQISSNSTDNDFKNQNYPGDTSGIKLQNWPSSNTTGAFVSSTYSVKAGNGTAQICAWTAQSTATGTVPDMFYSVRNGDTQQHIVRIGGNDIGRGMEISNNITLTGSRNSNIVNERFRVLPSENDGYDDSHIISAAQLAGNWEQGAGASNYDTSWGWLWQYASANNATRQIRAGIAYDHKGSEEFKYWSSYGAHTFYVDGGKSGDETPETCSTKAMQITHDGSVINTAQSRYGIYTIGNVWTTNQGQKNVQYLEDCYGQWIVVAKIQQSSHMQVNMSSVTQIDTSTDQATGTEWSAAWGDSYPSEVRFVSSSNWKNWRDNRGVDFIYGVPNGRQWKKFFTDNNTSGMTHGGNHWGNNNRWGFTIAGGYDGFGRYHNPNYAFLRVSDGNLTTVTNTFFTTAGQTMDMDTANDAKFSFHATAVSSGQDCDNHQSYGYDDSTYAHKNTYPATFSNHNGSDITAMPLWVCIKLDHNKEN